MGHLQEVRQHIADDEKSMDGMRSIASLSSNQYDNSNVARPGRRRRRSILPTSVGWITEMVEILTHPMEVDVSTEETTLHSAMKGLSAAHPAALRKGTFRVRFRGQIGVDEGGLRRDFFARLGQILCKHKCGLLMPAADGQLQLMRSQGHDDIPSWWWEAFGKLLGSAVLHEEPLGIHFVPPFCKQLLGAEVTFDDLEAVHPDWFRAMRSLRRLKVTAVKTLPEEPGCLILETNASHGAQPGEKVVIRFDECDGQYEVLHVPNLRQNELAVTLESSTSREVLAAQRSRISIRRQTSPEVNAVLSTMSYAVPSCTAISGGSSTTEGFLSTTHFDRAESAETSTRACPRSVSSVSSRYFASTPQLTTQNFENYVAAATCKLLCSNVEEQLKATKKGFTDVLGKGLQKDWSPEKWTRLRELLRGQPCVDLAAWRAATRSEGFPSSTSGDQIIDWWFQSLIAAPPGFRQKVLRWSTGWAAMPSDGWPHDKPFVIQRSGVDADHLPHAHTCTFTVSMPQYTSEAQLAFKLARAVEDLDFCTY